MKRRYKPLTYINCKPIFTNPPTEKQVKFVDEIAKELDIEFPNSSHDYTKFQYAKFIKYYFELYRQFKKLRNKKRF